MTDRIVESSLESDFKMDHRIVMLKEKKLTGKRMLMSFADNKTMELWAGFMPRRKEIHNIAGPELYSIQSYPALFFEKFNPTAVFEKWAAMEVTDHEAAPVEMENFILPGGWYVVFLYHGSSTEAASVFQYILGTWLPQSGYLLDTRPHFEILGEKYKNADPESEEEIWIPIKPNGSGGPLLP